MSTRVVILGGGFGGAFAAQELLNRGKGRVEVTLIDRQNYLLYYPLLVEAAVGTIEPRHVVVPTRMFLGDRGDFLMGEVVGADLAAKTVAVRADGEDGDREIPFDHLIVALGSITRVAPIPGLAEFGFQLKSLSDGISLRDRGIRLLERANATKNLAERRSLLRVVVVGANFTGVEFAGEYEAFLRGARRAYPNVQAEDIEIVLLEFSQRVLGMVSERLADYTVRQLTKHGIRVLTGTTLKTVWQTEVELTTGARLPTHTVLWAAGIAPNPLLAKMGLPLNEKGYVECGANMRVKGDEGVWAVGDAATIPDPSGKPYPATAQHSSRQGPAVARNILAVIDGNSPRPFVFKALGSFAAIGNHRAAANVLGFDLTGFPGWFAYRTAYLAKFPTFRMKTRLALDWAVDLIVPYAPAQLGLHTHDSLDSSD